MNRQRAYQGAVRGTSAAFVVVGLVILVVTLSAGGGPASLGFILGILFVAVGAGRFWLATRQLR